MTFFGLSMRAVAIAAAIVALAGVAIALGRPTPIENAVLGAEWQCSRTAFVVTTCSPRPQQATPAIEMSRGHALWPTKG